MALVLISTLAIGAVLAATPDRDPAERAARMLSRYGPGELPATGPVLAALETLGGGGDANCAPLLRSLEAHEQPAVAQAARTARSEVERRHRHSLRLAFIDALPRRDAISGWLEANPAASLDQTGERLGPHDQAALAYATLVLGHAGEDGPRDLELTSPEDATWLLAQAEDSARDGRLSESVATLAQAAASGSATAATELVELDIDIERLLLGMTTAARARPAAILPQHAVDALLPQHGKETVAVLIERAARPAPLPRAVALDALAELAEREVMTPRERAAAHRTMVAAAADPRPAVRALAATALSRSESD